MARRAREHRHEIPGYDETRPTREERRLSHRQVRHAAHQMLHTLEDPDELSALPEPRRDRSQNHQPNHTEPQKRRFKVWKTKFWKRRYSYRQTRAELDSRWPVITSDQLREEGR